MRCSACRAESPADSAFCVECGTPMEAGCPSCGAANPPNAKFCRRCGKPAKGVTMAVTAATRATPATAAQSPTSFGNGRYRVQRFLGDGATKRVYLARDTELGRDVAFAVIKTEGLDEAGVARIRRQAQAMRRLGAHPHIVTVFDVTEEEGRPSIISRYVAGADLASRLRESPGHRLPIAEALRIGEQICDALEHAHRRGVVHRELKPSNVWLTPSGDAILGDFGLALILDIARLTELGSVVMSALYMPPERALGKRVDARGDLYALGAILYETVTGRPPFLGDDTISIVSQHLNSAPVAPSWHNAEVPQALEALILRLLAKAPEGRPASAGEVHTALTRLVLARGTGAEPVVHREAEVLEPLSEGIFIGRRAELAKLKDGVESALAGRGRVVLLAGDAGIGKTRAAEELAIYARLRHSRVLVARCAEGTEIPPFWPWVQILRAYAATLDAPTFLAELGAGAGIIGKMMPEIGAELSRLAPTAPVDPERARFRLFAELATFFTNAAQRQPLLVMIDNLHWADGPSLLLLKFLAVELRDTGTFFLGTYRDTELPRSDPRSDIVASLRREPLFERIVLSGLSPDEVGALLTASTGGGRLPAAFIQTVAEETNGSPLFVAEMLRDLVETGALRQRDGRWSTGTAFLQGSGRGDVGETIARRLARLGDNATAVLQAASVIGGAFEFEVLEGVVRLSADDISAALQEGMRRRFVASHGARRYHFLHSIVRQLLYDQIDATRRLDLHHRAAELIEERSREEAQQPQLWAIAQHLTQASDPGDGDRAVDYVTRAGDWCASRLAYEEAAKYYQRALDLTRRQSPPDERRRCELLLALSEVLWPATEPRRARDSAQRAAELARRLGDPKLLARAALAFAPRLPAIAGATEDQALVDLLDEAAKSLGDADRALRARLLARRAEELLFSPGEEQRHALAREAIGLARQAEDPPTLAYVLRAAHWALSGPDNAAERLQMAEEIIALGALPEAAALEAQPLCVWDIIESGDLDAARSELQLCSRDATEAPHPYLVWAVGVSQTLFAIAEGRLLEAEALAQQTLQGALQAQNQNAPLVFGFHGAAIHQNQGRLPEAERLLQGILESHPPLAPCAQALLAHLYAEMGQAKEARRYFDLAAGAMATHPRNFTWLVYLAALAEASAVTEGNPQASALYDALLPYADRIAVAPPLLSLGPVSFHLGLLAAASGHPEKAAEHLENAHAIADRLGMRLTRARVRLAHAELLTTLAGDNNAERAVELLDRMLATANELSLAALAEKARSLRKRLRPEEEMAPEMSQAASTAATMATLASDSPPTAATRATMAPRSEARPAAAASLGQRADLNAGFVLANSYKFLEQIGKGGMGAVWSAQHLRLRGKRVAIKVLLEQASGIPEGYARFRHEAEIASRLGHPNIIEVLDFNELDDGTPYMVMEFLNGESLGRRMKGGAMGLDAVVPIVRQIGSALAAAHREGVVHRDLKPENIYLCPTGFGSGEHVKVLDFGISKMRDSDTIRTQVDVLIGTPRYMSPEQAMGRNDQIDGRTDIFALGAILYEMLTHRAAFSGDSLAQILYKIVHEPPTPLEQLIHDLPPRVVQAVARALEKDPAKRFAEVGELVLALG